MGRCGMDGCGGMETGRGLGFCVGRKVFRGVWFDLGGCLDVWGFDYAKEGSLVG